MRLGIVCPYSFDVPGGVQYHVRDLAESLIGRGHDVSVLAPADEDTPVPEFVRSTGRAVPVPYNGSVARLAFGPVVHTRVRRWLADGRFDLVHLHEPQIPSLSLMALHLCETPQVATFHTSMVRSRALTVFSGLMQPGLDKLRARIAVSEDARRTLVEHLGGDAVVIPNGVRTADFLDAAPDPRWTGTPEWPTVAFLGRIDEPRKGLALVAAAMPALTARFPGLRLLVAGSGDLDEGRELFAAHAGQVDFLGRITDGEKAGLLSAVDVYLAPQTGGESFGIVLVEAMAAGAAVAASDLPAFVRVLDDGRCGAVFRTGDSTDLAAKVGDLLADRARRADLAARARDWIPRFDWDTVTGQILTIYQMSSPEAAWD